MTLFHLAVLAIVQGITEFLPISSSGHLVLVWSLFDAQGDAATALTDLQRLGLDVAVHVGTLLAVCLYFRRDLAQMLVGMVRLLTGRRSPGARLALHVFIGTLPVVVAGFALHRYAPELFRSIEVVAWANLLFAVLLWLVDRFSLLIHRIEHMRLGQALIIGLAQTLALIPGTSRAGVTMTAARMLGYERGEAARFSLLLAIPAISGAGLLAGYDLYGSGDLSLGIDALIATGLSLVTALVAIAAMMHWLQRSSFTPFVVYRLLLGAGLLYLLYG